MRLLNYTPHAINVYDSSRNLYLTIESSGVARVDEKIIQLNKSIEKVPLVIKSYGEVIGLPEPREGTYYIVSTIVAQAVSHRKDLVVPSEPVRDLSGVMIGCQSFSITM